MRKEIFLPRLFTPFFNRLGGDYFVFLDAGTFSVKTALLQIKKDAIEIAGYSRKNHAGGDMNSNLGIDSDKIIETLNFALKDLGKFKGYGFLKSKQAIVGIGGGFIYGKTLPQSYIRENPHEEISDAEFTNILQKVQQRNFEAIRRDFKKDTGRSELEVRIINAAVQEIKVDGYQVVNPVGFAGKEVVVSLFNSYIAKEHLDSFMKIMSSIGLEVVSIICQPFAVFNSIIADEKLGKDFIILDVGGSDTEVAISRKAKLEDIRSIPIGGASFTRSISEGLKVGFWEAENIKYNFYEDKVSKNVAKKLFDLMSQDIDVFLRGLSMILSDFSRLNLLPSQVYVYGGGSMVPLLMRSLKQSEWRNTLSFFSKPSISALTPMFGVINNPREEFAKDLKETQWTSLVAMANMFVKEYQREDDTAKILKRSLRLIQN